VQNVGAQVDVAALEVAAHPHRGPREGEGRGGGRRERLSFFLKERSPYL
jgi:hypothetical protein